MKIDLSVSKISKIKKKIYEKLKKTCSIHNVENFSKVGLKVAK